MQQILSSLALIVIGGFLFLLVHFKSSVFFNWIDMKLLRKAIGDKYAIIILYIVSIALMITGVVVFLTAF